MPRPPCPLDVAFTSAMLEVGRLRNDINFAEWCRHIQLVDAALTRLCDAIDDGTPSVRQLARDAYMAVLSLSQVLYGAYSEDEHTSHTLELTQHAVGNLLDALEPFVTLEDRAMRRLLFDSDADEPTSPIALA